MLCHVEGSDESWVGYYWGDYISEIGGEDGSPVITQACLLYTSPSPRDLSTSRMPSSA